MTARPLQHAASLQRQPIPHEIWAKIFQEATVLTNFFDAKWDSPSGSIITAFDEAPRSIQSCLDDYAFSLRTKKAISLVCKDWRKLSWELVYSHIVIRRKSQLCALVRLFENSRPKTATDSHGLGWHVTHIKLLITGPDHDDRRVVAANLANEALKGRSLEPENDSTTNLVRRLLRCCSRLEVFLDAAPYAFDAEPRSVLPAITAAARAPVVEQQDESEIDTESKLRGRSESPLSSSLDGEGSPSNISHVRSLEWNYGSLSMSDFLDPEHAPVIQSMRSLRCNAIADPDWIFSTVQGTLRSTPFMQQLPPALLSLHTLTKCPTSAALPIIPRLRDTPLLNWANLASLDMYLSSKSHLHWSTLTTATSTSIAGTPLTRSGLPSLTHLTIRSPGSTGVWMGVEPMTCLHTFLRAYGSQLTSLDLRLTPGDVDPFRTPGPPPVGQFGGIPMNPEMAAMMGEVVGGAADVNAGMFDIPTILARCPNVEELSLSVRWPSPHSNMGPAAPPGQVNPNAPGGGEGIPQGQRRTFPSPFAIPAHDKLRRIGLRDATPHAHGYSASLANRACPCCRRVYMLSSASDAARDRDMGEPPYRPQMPSSSAHHSPSASPSLSSLLSTLSSSSSLSAVATSSQQHPFPSTLIDAFLSGALISQGSSNSNAPMTNRHCTIDRHLRTMLSGTPIVGEGEPYVPPFVRNGRRDRRKQAIDSILAEADRAMFGEARGAGGAQNLDQSEEDILRSTFGSLPRFPNLQSIQLLDSQESMFSNASAVRARATGASAGTGAGGRSSLASLHHGTTTTACATNCWCIPQESRVEMNFWGAWAARCAERGVRLLDRDGFLLTPIYAMGPSMLSGTMLPNGPGKVEHVDLQNELNFCVIRAALSRSHGGGSDRASSRSTGVGRSRGMMVPVPFVRPLMDGYTAASALMAITMRSKGPSDMSTREAIQRVLVWLAEYGVVNMTVGVISGVRDCINTAQFMVDATRILLS
ncbi:hypothetical protein DL93DRAFT_1599668 [Clavulina sp. PMI_390]|nr:hypothetical protein DL93DRAFT_1599668 [Clavulina sp. PMI_390]